MAKLIKALRPSSQAQCVARFLAMVVRNEMEDFHHEHLSDERQGSGSAHGLYGVGVQRAEGCA